MPASNELDERSKKNLERLRMGIALEHPELSYAVVGAAMEVHRLLGPGYPEKVYHLAMIHELGLRQIPFATE